MVRLLKCRQCRKSNVAENFFLKKGYIIRQLIQLETAQIVGRALNRADGEMLLELALGTTPAIELTWTLFSLKFVKYYYY